MAGHLLAAGLQALLPQVGGTERGAVRAGDAQRGRQGPTQGSMQENGKFNQKGDATPVDVHNQLIKSVAGGITMLG